MTFRLLTEHHLEFLSLKGDCTGSSESTLDKMSHCWKSHVMAHLFYGSIVYVFAMETQVHFDNTEYITCLTPYAITTIFRS